MYLLGNVKIDDGEPNAFSSKEHIQRELKKRIEAQKKALDAEMRLKYAAKPTEAPKPNAAKPATKRKSERAITIDGREYRMAEGVAKLRTGGVSDAALRRMYPEAFGGEYRGEYIDTQGGLRIAGGRITNR
jgi:hypothetical protein